MPDKGPGEEAISVSSLREYLAEEYSIEPTEFGHILFTYGKRIEVAQRFGDKTREVAREIMAAYQNITGENG